MVCTSQSFSAWHSLLRPQCSKLHATSSGPLGALLQVGSLAPVTLGLPLPELLALGQGAVEP